MKNAALILILSLAFVALSIVPAISQEKDTGTEGTLAETAPAVPAAATQAAVTNKTTQPNELSLYGEIQSVNTSANLLTIQYYDYDTDEEKTAEVTLDNDTKITNAANLADIKEGDWADIAYEVKDGKNIAKTIDVEKEEAMGEPAPAAEETVPGEE